MDVMRLADPWWLLLAIPAAGAIWLRTREVPSVLFSSLDGLRDLPATVALRVKRAMPLMFLAGLLFLLVAMARPQSGREDRTASTDGIAIQLVVDRSGSMSAEDLDPDRFDRRRVTRLDVVRDVLLDFIRPGGELPGRPDDLLGLVSFAGYAQVHCPLTLDHEALAGVLKTVEIPPLLFRGDDVQQTAIGDGLVLALNRLREIDAKSKVAVLLSDGENNAGMATPEEAARMAAADGVKVYTVGIGTGREMDEAALRRLAEATGGRYFRARSAEHLRGVYAAIDEMERSRITAVVSTRWRDRFPLFLATGLGILLLHRLLQDTRFRSLP